MKVTAWRVLEAKGCARSEERECGEELIREWRRRHHTGRVQEEDQGPRAGERGKVSSEGARPRGRSK